MIRPMTLTGKQKRTLKARGQKMPDDLHLGKAGLTEKALASLGQLLDKKEIAKVRFIELEGAERKSFAVALCEQAGAECVQVLGRTLLMYRANEELDAAKRALPVAGTDEKDETSDEESDE
jgi:RNA-binding protein